MMAVSLLLSHSIDAEEWTLPVLLGSTLARLAVDTGSSDIWVKGSKFPAAKSKDIGETFFIQYDSGGVMGRMVSDTLKLPSKLTPFGRDEVVLDAFPFAVSKDDWSGHDDSNGTSTIFSSLHSDGVLGLGLAELSTRAKHPKSFVGRLMAAGAIDAPQFFLSFARHDNGEPSSSSLLSFGNHRNDSLLQKRMQEPLRYAGVESRSGFWVTKVESFRVHSSPRPENDTIFDLCGGGETTQKSQCIALIDSGTSFLSLPRELLTPLQETITASQECTSGVGSSSAAGSALVCRCDDFASFPQIEVRLAPAVYLTLLPSDYLELLAPSDQKAVPQGPPFCLVGLRESSADGMGALWQRRRRELNTHHSTHIIILGTSLLKAYVCVFDEKNRRIGFSRSVLASPAAFAKLLLNANPIKKRSSAKFRIQNSYSTTIHSITTLKAYCAFLLQHLSSETKKTRKWLTKFQCLQCIGTRWLVLIMVVVVFFFSAVGRLLLTSSQTQLVVAEPGA